MTLTREDLSQIADIVRDEVTKALHPSVRAPAVDDAEGVMFYPLSGGPSRRLKAGAFLRELEERRHAE